MDYRSSTAFAVEILPKHRSRFLCVYQPNSDGIAVAQHYIDKLGLEPHPEGGYYRQLYGNDAVGN